MRDSIARKKTHSRETEEPISVRCDGHPLEGILSVPDKPKAIVLFSHGSGSSRFSPRNNFVAKELRQKGLATLLIDLLTPGEDQVYENRFDIPLLTNRLGSVAEWIRKESVVRSLPVGLFGASTGAASALILAARLGKDIYAVVSRGGRPDLAKEYLPQVISPTLLIVGGNDDVVVELNQRAFELLRAEKRIEIVPGATHLFEEPGALNVVAGNAGDWFTKYLQLNRREQSSVHAFG